MIDCLIAIYWESIVNSCQPNIYLYSLWSFYVYNIIYSYVVVYNFSIGQSIAWEKWCIIWKDYGGLFYFWNIVSMFIFFTLQKLEQSSVSEQVLLTTERVGILVTRCLDSDSNTTVSMSIQRLNIGKLLCIDVYLKLCIFFQLFLHYFHMKMTYWPRIV